MASVIQDFKMDILQRRDIAKLSLNNHYQVNLNALPYGVQQYLDRVGVSSRWIAENSGLMCADATLPTSAFATAEVKDNFHGVTQQFAHNRLYVESDFTFYVDQNYNMIKLFEGWMDYISGDDINANPIDSQAYFRRFNYPLAGRTSGGYKLSTMSITKFEKNDNSGIRPSLTYNFFNMFPKSMTAIPVAYGPADLLRVTVTFQYDRYYIEQDRATSVRSDNTIESRSNRLKNAFLNRLAIGALKRSNRRSTRRGNSTGRTPGIKNNSNYSQNQGRMGLSKGETIQEFKNNKSRYSSGVAGNGGGSGGTGGSDNS